MELSLVLRTVRVWSSFNMIYFPSTFEYNLQLYYVSNPLLAYFRQTGRTFWVTCRTISGKICSVYVPQYHCTMVVRWVKNKSERLMNRRLGKWGHPDQPNLHSHTERPALLTISMDQGFKSSCTGSADPRPSLFQSGLPKASVSGSGIAPVDCIGKGDWRWRGIRCK